MVSKAWHDNRVPTTTSELRCCYRNRDRWIPTGRLRFYQNLVEVEPPSVANRAVWARYDSALYNKHYPVLCTTARWFISGGTREAEQNQTFS